MENPHFMADLSDSPASMNPKEPKTAWPKRMVITSATMGRA